ncbi:MAG: hypothetical protein GY810_02340 [Aureispira sp.]|nr:hypothetical protein [Aureispira sp.]
MSYTNYHFKTKELTFWKKFLQVYWFNPKSWLLEEMIVEKDQITIIRKDGNIFKSHISELNTTYSVDRYYRKEFKIEDQHGNKTRFKEIPDMLNDEDWIRILILLDAKETKCSKILSFFSGILGK